MRDVIPAARAKEAADPSAKAADSSAPAAAAPIDAEKLKRSARLGVLALGARAIVLQLAIFGGNIALARLLDPGDFGAFAAVQFAISFFVFFGDVGLGGALVRQEAEPTEEQLSSVFYAQLGLAMALIIVIGVAATWVGYVWRGLPPSAPWLMRALALDLLLTAFRIVPSILMERHLQFGRLAIIDVIVQLSFYAGAVVLAALGFRVWALAVGVMLQGVVGLVAILVVRPWRPKLFFDRELLRPLLRFGVVYQAKNVVALANSAVTPVYAGAMLGAPKLGLINWAQSTAYLPLKLVEIVARVNFPLYSRLQGDKKLFADTLGRSIQLCAVVTLGFVSLYIGMGRRIIEVVYGDKWLPAESLLYVYAGAFSLGFLAPIVGAALDASGRPGLFFRLSIAWTALNWIIVLVTTPYWGIMGFVGGYVVHVVVGNIVVVLVVRRLLPGARLWPRVRASIVAALACAAVGRYAVSVWADSKLLFVPGILACIATYVLVLVAIDPATAREAMSFLSNRARPKPAE